MSYLSILENASTNDALSDEGREILSMAIDETKEFLNDREHETRNAVYQDQLNLLQVICDNHIALHSVEMLIQVRRGLITI
jgi:hypothetical protein